MLKTILFLLALSYLYSPAIQAQPELDLTLLTTASQPVDITGAGDGSGRLFIAEKGGKIRIFDLNSQTLLPDPFLDISSLVQNSGENGLLGLAFHPDFVNSGYFFVHYTQTGGSNMRISRFRADPPSGNTADPASELNLLTVPKPFNNHNGGDLAFGPDGYLYIGLGDGGGTGDPGNRAQNGQQLLGKMLRIDVDNTSGGNNYDIPTTNPFYGTQTPEILDEIWALGLRNPWRFSFDRNTGDLWIADVGQGSWEELNFQPAGSSGGENYGWRCYEGNAPYNTSGCGPQNNYDFPVVTYQTSVNFGRSITGGFVYRGAESPDLEGWYVMADYVTDRFWVVKFIGSNWVSDMQSGFGVNAIATFGEDDNGELYAGSLDGPIYKVSGLSLPVELVRFSGKFYDGRVQLQWTTATEKNAAYFQVERQTERSDFIPVGAVPATGESTVLREYRFNDPYAAAGQHYYRLKQVDHDSSFAYSPIVSVLVKDPVTWQLAPNPTTGQLTLTANSELKPDFLKFEIYDALGQLVFSRQIPAPAFPLNKEFNLGHLPKGAYFCRIDVGEKTALQRLVIR